MTKKQEEIIEWLKKGAILNRSHDGSHTSHYLQLPKDNNGKWQGFVTVNPKTFRKLVDGALVKRVETEKKSAFFTQFVIA